MLILTLTVLLTQAQVERGPRDNDALAAAAKAVFATKCVQCHGPDVPHPKAGFGYITDLHRLVESNSYIVPGNPEKSEIWQEISEGDMPPDEAKAGPLTQAESDAVLAWIVAGAPVGESGAATNPAVGHPRSGPQTTAVTPTIGSDVGGDRSPEEAPGQITLIRHIQRAAKLIGRFHVILVHFPVAMLLSGAMAESWAWMRRLKTPLPAVRFCLWVGAISALAAGSLGWVHAMDGFPGPSADPLTIAGLHRWIGTAVAVVAPVVALVVEQDTARGARSPRARRAIFALAFMAGTAAHFGGLLTHGSGFFDP